MEWFLILNLYSTDDVLIREFKTQQECEAYLSSHQAEFKKDKDIKSALCDQGAILRPSDKSSDQNI
jgi:hypothetical protein